MDGVAHVPLSNKGSMKPWQFALFVAMGFSQVFLLWPLLAAQPVAAAAVQAEPQYPVMKSRNGGPDLVLSPENIQQHIKTSLENEQVLKQELQQREQEILELEKRLDALSLGGACS